MSAIGGRRRWGRGRAGLDCRPRCVAVDTVLSGFSEVVQGIQQRGHVVKMSFLLAGAAIPIALAACAQRAPTAPMRSPTSASGATPPLKMTRGEVRKVDAATGMLTLHAGPVENLRLPEMTMMFAVVDRRMLEIVKKGDSVLFTADLVDGRIAVTHLELCR